MVVHHLGLDGDFDNEGDRVAKGLEFEPRHDVGRLERPVGQFSQPYISAIRVSPAPLEQAILQLDQPGVAEPSGAPK